MKVLPIFLIASTTDVIYAHPSPRHSILSRRNGDLKAISKVNSPSFYPNEHVSFHHISKRSNVDYCKDDDNKPVEKSHSYSTSAKNSTGKDDPIQKDRLDRLGAIPGLTDTDGHCWCIHGAPDKNSSSSISGGTSDRNGHHTNQPTKTTLDDYSKSSPVPDTPSPIPPSPKECSGDEPPLEKRNPVSTPSNSADDKKRSEPIKGDKNLSPQGEQPSASNIPYVYPGKEGPVKEAAKEQ